MKHKINVQTGICSSCGLSLNQKLTTHCRHAQLTTQSIKRVVNNEIDFINDRWINIQNKPTIKITPMGDIPPEVRQAMSKVIQDLFGADIDEVIEDKPIVDTSPDFSPDELKLLQDIKDNPIPINVVLNMELSKPNMDRLRTLMKFGAVAIWENYYQVTLYGESFLTKPEEAKPELLSISEISFMFCCARKPWLIKDVAMDQEAVATYSTLAKKGLVMSPKQHVILTQAGHDHIAKLCAIPL